MQHLGKPSEDGEPLTILTVLESNGLDDALWCLRAVDGCEKDARLFAVWCARQVQHLMTDPRSIAALEVAERFANGAATSDELATAWDAAWAAAMAAARDAAGDAAGDAAMAAAMAAVGAASRDAAWAASRAASRDAAGDAARAAQEARLRQLLSGATVTTT